MSVASPGDAATVTLEVTDGTIDRFAAIVGDHNPIHLDDDYASETMFGGRVAHGMLSAGVISAALADLPGDVVYLAQDLTFEAPVRPGTTLEATVTVESVSDDDRLDVETIARADGERVVSGSATILSMDHAD